MWVRPGTSDLDVVVQIFLHRSYDLTWCAPYKEHIEDMCRRAREVGEVPLIVDAGANIGASTLWFSTQFPDCQVFAIEPDPGNFALLERNVKDRPNVTLFHAGLWDRPANLSFVSDTDANWSRRVAEDVGPDVATFSITVPELLRRGEHLRPMIIKIDIEGAETALFRSNTEWADGVPLLIFEPHDNLWAWLGTWKGTGHAFFSTLSRHKREYLMRGENVFAFLHPEPA